MTVTAVARKSGGELVRSPQVLAPLIEEQVRLGYRAGEAFFAKAGLYLLEARKSIPSDHKWSKYITARKISNNQSSDWMRLGRSTLMGLGHRTIKEAKRDPRTREDRVQQGRRGAGLSGGLGTRTTDGGRAGRNQIEDKIREQEAADYRARSAKLRAKMLRLVAAGYRDLAKKDHPDAGGSADEMVLLREARDLLMGYAEGWK